MSELKAIESATAVIENVHLVYRKSDVDAVIAELKSRESVLVTDNRNLLDKVKNLENHLHENAEHYKRNEAQIIENADKVIAEKDTEIRRLKRALWLARANYCHNFRIVWYISRHHGTKRTKSIMENTLIIAELKCRAKAEQFK